MATEERAGNGGVLQLLGKERFRDSYGWHDHEYYLVVGRGMVEERQLTGRRDAWVVTRYLGVGDVVLHPFCAKLSVLAAEERKSKRGHDEMMRLLRSCPSVSGYVELGDIDKPGRRVVTAFGQNMPFGSDWAAVFADGVEVSRG